jgi:hypothetical protein
MTRIRDDQPRNVFKIWLERISHGRNGILPADREEPDMRLAFELLLVEIHDFDGVAAIVESRVHSALACISADIRSYILRRDGSKLVHFVFEPPSDIDVLFSSGELRRQVRKLLENKLPLSLVVGDLRIIA